MSTDRVITEQLQEGDLDMKVVEAMLLALGIHTDMCCRAFILLPLGADCLRHASSDLLSVVGHVTTV